MKTHRCSVPFLALLALATPLVAQPQDNGICKDPLPFVINLGLPRMPRAPEFDAEVVRREVESFMKEFYQEHGKCYGQRPLQVNITLATDYEILDWLRQGLLQAAVVPDLTLYLLKQRDGLDLRKVQITNPKQGQSHKVGDLLLPALEARPLSGQLVDGHWHSRRTPMRDLEAFKRQLWREASGQSRKEGEPDYRIVLASHLSTTGFLDPILDMRPWPGGDDFRERFWQAFFDHARFTIDCDTLDKDPGPDARSCWERPPGDNSSAIEILFPGETTLRRERGRGAAGPAQGKGYREHFVLAGTEADKIFPNPGKDGTGHLQPAVPTYNRELSRLFADRRNDLPRPEPEYRPLHPFEALLSPEPLFGVRAFNFTIDEAMRLLRQDQDTSTQARLSLVLPGGGVKAAYQSRIIDELYGRGYLKNFRADAKPGRTPLKVEYVIGTSGGALLGFFVSQLGPHGPWNLTDILWTKDGGKARREGREKEIPYLKSSDVFGGTDLLRYASVVASFLVLCVLLAVLLIGERAPLRSPSPASEGVWRGRLTLAVMPLLLVAPVLVRWCNERTPRALEEIPQIEGFIYAVLTMLAMYADQCLVLGPEARDTGDPWVPPAVPLLFGSALIGIPLLAKMPFLAEGRLGTLMDEGLTFGLAYTILAPLVLVCGLILPLRIHTMSLISQERAIRLTVELVAPIALSLGLGLFNGHWLEKIQLPYFLNGFGLVAVILAANFFLSPSAKRFKGRAWWLGYATALLVTSLLVMLLCWPEIDAVARANPRQALASPTLDISVGTFFLCLGLLILLLGGIVWTYSSQCNYRLSATSDFRGAFLAVLVHLVAVGLILWALAEIFPNLISTLELTGTFWKWLLGTSFVVGLVLLRIALKGNGRNRIVDWLRKAFVFLSSHHPNGDFVTRRFLRLALLAVFSLVWWNAILAPALYGNGKAQGYLLDAVKEFNKQARLKSYTPSTRFIAPANLLVRDGTRYFLFVPDANQEGDCPVLPDRLTSGAEWYAYSIRPPKGESRCKEVPESDDTPREAFLRRAVFASGSPFPIFPAHGLLLSRRALPDPKEEPTYLVDGGYSNNVPVDAALTVSMEQVLIVESTNPLLKESDQSAFVRALLRLRGKLIENLGRLPNYMFERSQQIDRLSRRDLFVVSISPSRTEKDWPALFDFRRHRVIQMTDVAEKDLKRRVGMVQSWGLPSFPLSVLVAKEDTR